MLINVAADAAPANTSIIAATIKNLAVFVIQKHLHNIFPCFGQNDFINEKKFFPHNHGYAILPNMND